jgi:hypothetical protein
VPSQQFLEELSGDVDIAAQSIGGVTSQEEAVEQRRLPLRRHRIEFIHIRHRVTKTAV